MNKSSGQLYSTNETTVRPAALTQKAPCMDATTFFDETAVVTNARKGNRHAFGELVKAYQRRAYVTAYGFVGNREDALDLAQEAFARAYRAMHRFDTGMPFYPWLHRIIRNACLNHLKKKRRHRETSLDELVESGHEVTCEKDSPDHAAGLGELRGAVARAMATLSPEHREILVLRHFQELSYAEIAACLGVPQGTVMSRLHAARRALRNRMEDFL